MKRPKIDPVRRMATMPDGTEMPLADSPFDLPVQFNDDDRDNAKPLKPNECVTAQYLIREHHCQYPDVGRDYTFADFYVEGVLTYLRFVNPIAAKTIIKINDNYPKSIPLTTFLLLRPTGSQRLEPRREAQKKWRESQRSKKAAQAASAAMPFQAPNPEPPIAEPTPKKKILSDAAAEQDSRPVIKGTLETSEKEDREIKKAASSNIKKERPYFMRLRESGTGKHRFNRQIIRAKKGS